MTVIRPKSPVGLHLLPAALCPALFDHQLSTAHNFSAGCWVLSALRFRNYDLDNELNYGMGNPNVLPAENERCHRLRHRDALQRAKESKLASDEKRP